jgi:hypothetical protein
MSHAQAASERYERRHANNYLWDSSYHWGEWLELDDNTPGLLFSSELTPEIQRAAVFAFLGALSIQPVKGVR